ncbi:ROK family protein [Naasia lichenicola]|uniref:ROK family protein n=1 Tax=Naasia lichenicola TaxID=2565933 RepID=A0A4S4FHJ3_9MICO|nr:ROK family protein [Naasia lichenicola]THG29272.1 ROK family protein [Naasia lichenicola]
MWYRCHIGIHTDAADDRAEKGSAMQSVLALDIGGTKLATGVVTSDGSVHGFTAVPTRRDEGPDVIIPRLFELGRQSMRAAEQAGVSAPEGVGISCGGPLDAAAGVLVNPLHLPGWIDVPIVELAQREFELPAALENDATLAALAEHRHGAAVGERSMIYLTISTGIGGGAVLDDRLYRGAAGNGGEFGHITVVRGGRPCLCGRNGCLEAYASGTFIGVRADEAIASGRATSLTSPATAEQVARAAASGDALASEIWDETVELLGQAITDFVNIIEPDVVVLGGGVTRSGAQLLDPIRRIVLAGAMRPAAAAVRVELAALGDTVCVVGAGDLALDLLAVH